ncbi:hypothetical protein OG21DRAFT_783260 [Imleria badia]|nr:hypothetical protein OG21DRAFT_783260 [Imleria badia]
MLDPSSQWDYERVLMAWAQATLTDELWKKALATARGFKVPGFTVYQAVCERLEMVNRIVEATECFHEMENRSAQALQGKEAKWAADFKYRCCGRLEAVGDTAMNARRYDEAISHYSAALSLSPTVPQALLVKRSAAYAAREVWQYALNDANEAIALDPSWPFVYEKKYVALRGAGNHQDAIDAFETMLSKMSQSLDPDTRERHRQYTRTKELIRGSIQEAIRESPRMLINTASGRICNKSEQAAAFELLPVFTELISSMTTHVNHARIEQEVKQYYRYATFSHKWEASEPLFDKVINIVVYELEDSPTHDKLQMFCKIVREAGFNWAWSDTCCINKSDHFVLQEALVAMFKWYEGSSLTVIFLRGVHSPSQHGDLIRSVWNTRAWTFQEYHASKVVRFYTEDWTLYRNLDIPNHKDSPEIIAEMEEATSISAQALMALRPGLDDIREKLCLASRRETTFVEDAAYSLLGIFSVSLPVVYGEGDRSLGRLLAQLLTSSGDTSILAWTGKSGSFNSCLPTHIAVFSQLPTTHIPPVIERAEMDIIAARLRASALDFTLAVKLHDRLNELPVPLFAGRRMKLPCITFKLGPLSVSRSASEYVFRAQTAALGIVAIKTKENLSSLGSLYLVHPWIDFLLDRQPVGRVTESIYEENIDCRFSSISDLPPYPGTSNMTSAVRQSSATRSVSHLGQSFHRPLPAPPQYSDVASLRPPSTISPMDKEMRALRLIARLRQPFGALLLTPNLGNAYSRVAAESLITVQVEGITPTILNKLVDSVHILDVL